MAQILLYFFATSLGLFSPLILGAGSKSYNGLALTPQMGWVHLNSHATIAGHRY